MHTTLRVLCAVIARSRSASELLVNANEVRIVHQKGNAPSFQSYRACFGKSLRRLLYGNGEAIMPRPDVLMVERRKSVRQTALKMRSESKEIEYNTFLNRLAQKLDITTSKVALFVQFWVEGKILKVVDGKIFKATEEISQIVVQQVGSPQQNAENAGIVAVQQAQKEPDKPTTQRPAFNTREERDAYYEGWLKRHAGRSLQLDWYLDQASNYLGVSKEKIEDELRRLLYKGLISRKEDHDVLTGKKIVVLVLPKIDPPVIAPEPLPVPVVVPEVALPPPPAPAPVVEVAPEPVVVPEVVEEEWFSVNEWYENAFTYAKKHNMKMMTREMWLPHLKKEAGRLEIEFSDDGKSYRNLK